MVVGCIRTEVGSSGQGVWANEGGSGEVGELGVKVCQVYKPAGLSSVEMLGLPEICEVFMVGEHLYWKRGPSKVMAPRETTKLTQELAVKLEQGRDLCQWHSMAN